MGRGNVRIGFTVPMAGLGPFVIDIGGPVVERLVALEVHRGFIVDARVATMRVVPTLDVIKDLHARHGVGVETAPVDELTFEGGEEALTERIGLSCRMHPMRTLGIDVSK